MNIYKFRDTRYGYEVPGTTLLHYLKGAMQLSRTKNRSVHVSTCTSYNFNALTPVVCKLWHCFPGLWKCQVFLS